MKRRDEPDPARVYNDNVREFITHGKVDRAASEARDYVEREPERKARRSHRGSVRSVDDLIEMGRTVMDRVRRGISMLRERYHHRK